jgi:cysteine-rich repeat protein
VSTTTTTVTSTTTTTTIPEPCGNGTLETGEECDDGNPISTDGCTDACTICGNDTVTAPEECDDGDLTSGDGCDANCTTTGCGNGVLTAPETCDDGNTENNDNCPSNCIILGCDPDFGSDRAVDVEVSSGDLVAGLTVLLDYPEGKVRVPGSGGSVPAGIVTDLPLGALGVTNDLDHALRQVLAGAFEIPDGLLFRVHFENCVGAPSPVRGDFTCEVLDAADTSGAPLPGVTCAVAGLPTGTTSTTAASTSTTGATTTTTTGATVTTTTGATTSTTAASTTSTTGATTSTTGVSTTSTTGASTTTTTISPLCGNGTPNPGETCDDGNQSNNDACPTDCVVDACTPVTGTQRNFDVLFTPNEGVNVGGITVLLDYPEGRVEIQGPPHPGGTFSMVPTGSFPVVQDWNHTARVTVAIGGGNPLPPGKLIRVRFRDCSGATPPTPANFACTVLEATDPFSNPVTNEVSCSVVAP